MLTETKFVELVRHLGSHEAAHNFCKSNGFVERQEGYFNDQTGEAYLWQSGPKPAPREARAVPKPIKRGSAK